MEDKYEQPSANAIQPFNLISVVGGRCKTASLFIANELIIYSKVPTLPTTFANSITIESKLINGKSVARRLRCACTAGM